jgi:hypothetical protein
MEMTRDQAVEICKNLACLYPQSALTNESAREQYISVMVSMDFEMTKEAIHKCLMECKFCPTISEIKTGYISILQRHQMGREPSGQRCSKCKGAGVFAYEKAEDKLIYKYIAHCTCEAGQQYAIKTKNREVRPHTSFPQDFWKKETDEFAAVPMNSLITQIKGFLAQMAKN